MSHVRYFAYGSNMQSATLRGRRTVEPASATAACAKGWRLVLDKPGILMADEGMANIVADQGSDVFGVLYEIRTEDMEHLDLTEGVLIGNYARAEILVRPLAEGGEDTRAFTFVSIHRREGLQPSIRYMSLLVDGALEHGLPAPYVDWLRSIPSRPTTEESALWRPVLDHAMKRS